MKQQSFQLQKNTIQFFYEVDLYWKEHLTEKKNKIIKKLKPLYKGFTGWIISPTREAFLYRDLSKLPSYKLIKNCISQEDFINLTLNKEFFKTFYDTMCAYYFKALGYNEIKVIHDLYKDKEFPLTEDTYLHCLQ